VPRPRRGPVTYHGPLAAVLSGLVAEKQGAGYRYEAVAQDLLQIDRFLLAVGHQEVSLSRELVLRWALKRPHETESTRRHRISLIRVVGEYMQRCGYPAYVYPLRADGRASSDHTPYIFTRGELACLFRSIDTTRPDRAAPQRHHVLPMLFRLLYGCGLRISEALALRVEDVDLDRGVIHIREAKFGKERVVPLHPKLTERFREYLAALPVPYGAEHAVFPSVDGRAYPAATVYKYFRRFLWSAGISHGGRGRGPRLHDLRHTFAVHCLQRWVAEGVDLSVALPYLSAYLGHTGLKGTQHYLRLTAELYPHIVATMERHFGAMLPGEASQ
jgi:integrase/recombinase XerD